MRLRYTGPHPTVFAYQGVALVSPGDEFWVADRDAPGFLARADVEEASEPERAPKLPAADAAPDPPTRTKGRKTPAPAGDEPAGAAELTP